jgi:hypothetical protein
VLRTFVIRVCLVVAFVICSSAVTSFLMMSVTGFFVVFATFFAVFSVSAPVLLMEHSRFGELVTFTSSQSKPEKARRSDNPAEKFHGFSCNRGPAVLQLPSSGNFLRELRLSDQF